MPGKSDYTALAARTQGYALQVKRLYDEAVKELLALANQGKRLDNIGDDEMFTFDMYESLKDKSERALRKLHGAVYTATKRGIELEWGRADKAADDFVASVFGKTVLRDNKYAAMLLRHESAMDAFINRIDKGMNLSDKVWQPVEQLRKEMELAITVSIGEGESASTISRRVRQYLNEPDKLFRRVRDEKGNLKLSKAAAEYHPGRGVYRSSYKNAMRLARTETNMAYRTEDCNRVEDLDFVLGIRIQTSNNHPEDDICDELAGDYPKTFHWTGWHPQCRCYMTTILPSDEELKKYNKALLNGEDYSFNGYVKEYPDSFKEWVVDHQDKIENGRSVPYFVKDNQSVIDNILGKETTPAPTPTPTPAPAPFKYETINDPHLSYLASQKGMSQEQRLENLLNGIEGLYGNNSPVVRIIKSWDLSDPNNVKRALDVLKTNGWSSKEDLEVYKTISHLNELMSADFSAVPQQWQNTLNGLIKKINAHDMTQGCLGVYPEIEHAYNIYKLATTKEALEYGLDKLSDKTPYNLFTTIGKKINGFPIPRKEFFDKLDRFVPLVTEGKDAFYSPKFKHVCVSMDAKFVERLSTSQWFQTGLMYHEFGHALDWQKGLKSNAELVKIYDDWKANVVKDGGKALEDAIKAILDPERKKFNDWWDDFDEKKALRTAMQDAIKMHDFAQYNKLDKEYYKLYEKKYREMLGDLEEQLGALSDCIEAAFDGKRRIPPMGHDTRYFYKKENQLAEFIAHCSENYWNNNQYFKQIDPDLYELMSEWVKGL